MHEDPRPLQKVQDGGWRWGNKGKTYYGPDAKDRAIRQGMAILRTRNQIDEDNFVIFPYGDIYG